MLQLHRARKRNVTLAGLLILGMAPASVLADGTEELGAPVGITIEAGSGIAAGGIGLDVQPGDLTVDVPAGAVVKQVLLYWSGEFYEGG